MAGLPAQARTDQRLLNLIARTLVSFRMSHECLRAMRPVQHLNRPFPPTLIASPHHDFRCA